MLELSGTPDRARVLGGTLDEAERRVLRLFLGAALAGLSESLREGLEDALRRGAL